MKAISVIALLITSLICCGHNCYSVEIQSNGEVSNHKAIAKAGDSLTYTILNNTDKTFGYDILKNGKVFIHQTSIPVVQGNSGFKTKAIAQKVAVLVIQKMKKGEMPPSITLLELKSCGVTF